MGYQAVGIALVAVLFFVVRSFNRTDVPRIKGLPEIPGVPVFGNLLQLGDSHAKRAREWVRKYGPVFQVRLGNRVGDLIALSLQTSKLSRGSSLPIPLKASNICGLPINPP